jgi:hypothetical protein
MDAFYYLLQPQLQKLCDPAIDCLEYVHQSIEKLTVRLLAKQCQRFPALHFDLEDKILKLLYDRKEKTKEIIQEVLDYEMGYLFTNDDKGFNSFLGIIIIKLMLIKMSIQKNNSFLNYAAK